MKNIIVAISMAGMILGGCGSHISETEVPSVVVNAVKSKYTFSEKIEWEKWTNGYEAEFYLGKVETTLYVDSTGSIVLQKQELAKEALPVVIAAAIAGNYKNYQVDEAEKLYKDGVVYYEVELDGKGTNKDVALVFTEDGKPTNAFNNWK